MAGFLRILTGMTTKTSKGVHLDIIELQDPYGPTITDETIDAIVVSSETIVGAFKINEIREGKGFQPLNILVTRRTDAASLSSTNIREQESTHNNNETTK